MKIIFRRFILIIFDSILILASIWLVLGINNANEFSLALSSFKWIYFTSIITGISIFIFSGQYKGLTRYTSSLALYEIALRNILMTTLVFLYGNFKSYPLPNNKSWILICFLSTFSLGAIRILLRDILVAYKKKKNKRINNVIIYGAGSTGAQLAESLRINGEYKVLSFIDDDKGLWKRSLNGIKIKPPEEMIDFFEKIDKVLIAVPSISRNKKKSIFNTFKNKGIEVLQIPSLSEITTTRKITDQLLPIKIEDLLGRDPVPADKSLLEAGVKNSVICVTGAGGSIGSELCRKIINFNPKELILIDHSEFALFEIERELKSIYPNGPKIIAALGSTTNYEFLNYIFQKNNINKVFHASAYKHVALVEKNIISGLANNVLSTKYICEAVIKNNVQHLTLISSDKAVRPTNIMGASKRLSEIICQTFAENINKNQKEDSNKCCISMVRFGNVLGSSGSVVPIFKKQILNGGPITLTHKNVIRYFMTISEACELVLQSSFLANGGEVFLLDMGEPVLIKDLAEQLISLSGLSIKNKRNPNGDVEIKYIGLKDGEKLYEELLIDSESYPTKHPLIFKANESSKVSFIQLQNFLEKLEINIKNRNEKEILDLIKKLVPEWKNSLKN